MEKGGSGMENSRKRLIARYAVDRGEHFEIVTRYDTETTRERADRQEPRAPSLMPRYPAANWFERKIADDFGIRFEGAYDFRPLLHHERWPVGNHPMRKDFDVHRVLEFSEYRPYKYEAVGGDGVFEVAVGPIHAGIIEPGHFHFSQAGEEMLHQEVRHFYKYRGIEKMLEGKSLAEAAPIVARISGNESVATQIALARISAQVEKKDLSEALQARWGILLELERIAHHWTDLGFIPNDAGFGAALAFASARAEETRRQLRDLTGHRFAFDALMREPRPWDREELIRWCRHMSQEAKWFEEWITDIPSLWDRMDTTGILTSGNALRYGCVGVVARASSVELDVRSEEPFYRERGFEPKQESSGDVAARFKVRLMELKHSLELIETFAKEASSEGFAFTETGEGAFESFVESSLGELYMAIELVGGKISRFFVRDPSFINWQALHLMMPGNIIADFPLINKSCDLSYAGNDL